MWKSLGFALNAGIKANTQLLKAEIVLEQQLRTTYILKRKFPAPLHKKGKPQKTLRSKHYVYDLIQQTHTEQQPNIDIVLMSYVEGVGNAGDKVSVKPNYAYNNILLPGLGVYATPDNIDKYETNIVENEIIPSSTNAPLTVKIMSRMILSVVMNMEQSWTIKPWHIKASFRKCGYIVPEDAVTLPEKPITGPDMNLENKEFFVTVTVNNHEKVNVRCRIHHWSTVLTNRIPYIPYFWEEPCEPIFPEQSAVLETLPKKPVKKNRVNV